MSVHLRQGRRFCDVTVYATVYICARVCQISGKVVEGSRQNFCTSIATGQGKRKRPVYLAEPKGCSSPGHRQWVDKPLLFVTHGQRNARPSQPQCITALWPVPNYTLLHLLLVTLVLNVVKRLFILQYVDAPTCQSIDRWSAGRRLTCWRTWRTASAAWTWRRLSTWRETSRSRWRTADVVTSAAPWRQTPPAAPAAAADDDANHPHLHGAPIKSRPLQPLADNSTV